MLTTLIRQTSDHSKSSSFGSCSSVSEVPECIVHRETPAVILKNDKTYDSLAISDNLASEVVRKAWAFSIDLTDSSNNLCCVRGQGGYIRCSAPLEEPPPPSPLMKRRQEYLQQMYASERESGQPSTSTERISVIPVTSKHNVMKTSIYGDDFLQISSPKMTNTPEAGGLVKIQEFRRQGEVLPGTEKIDIDFLDSYKPFQKVSWKYGIGITDAEPICKKNIEQTDQTVSFEAVSSDFKFKVGQKIGIAVYRNYEFDFKTDEVYDINGWDKNDLKIDDIKTIFGNDYAVNIYTGEITAVSTDKKAFLHDINAFKGCSGVIVFLLDKNQDGLVDAQDYGKAIGVHAGGHTINVTSNRTKQAISFNVAFTFAGLESDDRKKSAKSTGNENTTTGTPKVKQAQKDNNEIDTDSADDNDRKKKKKRSRGGSRNNSDDYKKKKKKKSGKS